MINASNKKIIKLTQMSLLVAISLILLIFIRIPIIPSAPFLVYDMADVPIIIGTLLYGTIPGIAILFVVSIIQAFLLGGDSIIGFIMHFFSSGAMVICIGIISQKFANKSNTKYIYTIISMAIGVIAMTICMIPMNYIFTVNFYGIPKEVLDNLIFTAIVPFNLIKGGINCCVSFIIYRLLQPFLRKNKRIF